MGRVSQVVYNDVLLSLEGFRITRGPAGLLWNIAVLSYTPEIPQIISAEQDLP